MSIDDDNKESAAGFEDDQKRERVGKGTATATKGEGGGAIEKKYNRMEVKI